MLTGDSQRAAIQAEMAWILESAVFSAQGQFEVAATEIGPWKEEPSS